MGSPAKNLDHTDELWRLFPHTYAEKMMCVQGSTSEDWVAFDYLKMISRKIAAMVAKGGGKLIVSLPPRHGKSTLISFWTPIWFLDLFPNKKVILATYSASFAAGWGRKVRNEIQANPAINVAISPDSSAADSWATTSGDGGMNTAGIGGPLTGKGGHLIIIDDPVKNWQEAESETIQGRNYDWMRTVTRTRAEPGAVFVVLQTRWHESDLSGKLIDEGTWDVINIPATCDNEETDPMGRKDGEALCPARYDEEALAEIRIDIGERFYAALFQGQPSPAEGDIFKRQWWKYYDELPSGITKWCQSVDPSFTDKKTSAYCVIQTWAAKQADFYLVDQFREKMGYIASEKALIAAASKWPQCTKHYIEKTANGYALIENLRALIPGIIPITPKGSKTARAEAVSGFVQSGNVWLPRPKDHKWVEAFIEEHATFPNSKYKDQVDTATQALWQMKPKKVDKIGPQGMFKSSTWRV